MKSELQQTDPLQPELQQPEPKQPQEDSNGKPSTQTPMVHLSTSINQSNSGSPLVQNTKDMDTTHKQDTKTYIPREVITEDFLAALSWSRLLENKPGWRWDAEERELRCPNNEPMHWRCARRETNHSLALGFRIKNRVTCRGCVLRSGCTKSHAQNY